MFFCGEGGLGHEGDAAVGERYNGCHLSGVYFRSDLFDIDWI